MAFKDAFNDITEAYNEDMRYLYNRNTVKYKKFDPERNSKTSLVDSYWENNDEENQTAHYSGF